MGKADQLTGRTGTRPAVTGGKVPGVVAPASVKELREVVRPESGHPKPLRPMGANSSCTSCNVAVGGTVIDTTRLKHIAPIDGDTITVDAGVTLRELVDALDERGMEISGSLDLMNRTVGGAVASGCFGPAFDGRTAYIASQAVSMRVVTPDGALLDIDETQGNLLSAMRISFGALGVIANVTFRVRPRQQFVLKQRKMDIVTFGRAARTLAQQPVGLKFFYLPFKDSLYTELRRAQVEQTGKVRSLPWKLKEMGETTVLPSICSKLGRIVPLSGLRYSLVDGLHEMSQVLFTNTLTEGGTSAVEHPAQSSGKYVGPPLEYSTWCFPVEEIGMLLQGYRAFASEYYARHRFRCDMPAVGFRLPADQSALLSPSFERPMFALRFVSSPHPAWEDFVMDLAELAQNWGGVPVLNQTRCAEPGHVIATLGTRLEFFRKIRRRMDPDGRFLNPFLAQYLA